MDNNQRLHLQKMINANNVEDNTDLIRQLKHSHILREDVNNLIMLKSKYLDLRKFEIVSISLKEDDEIILLSDKELPWGNRKLVISDEFKDRKEEVLEFLKIIFLNK